MKWKKRRRRTTQVFATEKPNPYVIISFLATGLALLLYCFWPFGGVTSPAKPQPGSPLATNMSTVVPMASDSPADNPPATNAPGPMIPQDAQTPTANVVDTGVPPGPAPTNVPTGAEQPK